MPEEIHEKILEVVENNAKPSEILDVNETNSQKSSPTIWELYVIKGNESIYGIF